MGGQEEPRRRRERKSLNLFGGGVLEDDASSKYKAQPGLVRFRSRTPHLGRQPLLKQSRHQPANPARRGLWLCSSTRASAIAAAHAIHYSRRCCAGSLR